MRHDEGTANGNGGTRNRRGGRKGAGRGGRCGWSRQLGHLLHGGGHAAEALLRRHEGSCTHRPELARLLQADIRLLQADLRLLQADLPLVTCPYGDMFYNQPLITQIR